MGTLVVAGVLSACGGSCPPDNSKPLNPLNVDLYLDYVGTVPVLNGAATSSYFYVHNDGESAISGISYSLAGSNGATSDANGFSLDSSSLSSCASIAAHSYCKIKFTTPSLSLGNQNNSLFKVSVKDANGFVHTYDQVINYSYYNVELNSGVNFATSADVVANLTNKRYMMSYLVGGGSVGKSYTNVNLVVSDSGSVTLEQGFESGQSVVSGELIPVEFAVNILSVQPTPINITPQYSQNSVQSVRSLQATQVMAGQSLYVMTSSKTSSAQALKIGVIPVLSAPSDASNGATIYVSNFGESINGLSVTGGSGIQVYNNTCNVSIESNASCSFVLGVDGNNSGSGEVNFLVNGEAVMTKTVYFQSSSNPSALLTSSTAVTQIGLQPNQSSSLINIVLSNLGNAAIESLILTPQSGNSSQLKIINNNCQTSLAVNSQCLVQVQLIGGNPGEQGSVYLNVTYGSVTSQTSPIKYTIADNSNIIISNPVGAESTLVILGDGYESASTVFTFKNVGTTDSPINSLTLVGVNLPNSLTVESNNCGASLAAGNSCQVRVKYGPNNPESNISGIANLQINYGARKNTLSGIIKYQTVALDSQLKITNVTASGYTGSGTESSPYVGSGCNSDPLLITITYKNTSDNYVAQNFALNIIDGHVSPYMSVESTLTTCGYGSKVESLGIGQSCNLVLKADRSAMTDNNSFNLDIIYPSASWNTTQGFVRQEYFSYNGSSGVRVNYSQPTLVSTINPESSNSLQRTLNQTFVATAGCNSSFTTVISAVPNVESVTVTSGNCTVNNDKSVSCINSSSESINVLSYSIESTIPRPSDLFMQFRLDNAGKSIWYNPEILMFKVESAQG